jgi:hypothetical protein
MSVCLSVIKEGRNAIKLERDETKRLRRGDDKVENRHPSQTHPFMIRCRDNRQNEFHGKTID